MRGNSWATLLQFIPPELHDNLMVVTKAGIEITVGNILRVDHEFLAFKGRLAGSQDAGRLFMVPYANIEYLGWMKQVKDSEFHETFDNLVMPEPTAAAPVAPSAAAGAEGKGGAGGAGRSSPTLKSAVLERFRSRSTTVIGTLPTGSIPVSSNPPPRPPADG
jgi:hypothetical protein